MLSARTERYDIGLLRSSVPLFKMCCVGVLCSVAAQYNDYRLARLARIMASSHSRKRSAVMAHMVDLDPPHH